MIKASWSISCDIGPDSATGPLVYIEAETRAEAMAMAKASRLGWQFDGDRCLCPIHRPVGIAE